MKLIDKTSLYYILFTLPVLVISAIFSYWFMMHELGESNEDLLQTRAEVVEQHLLQNDTLILNIFKENKELFIKEIDRKVSILQKISDTLIYSEIQKEFVMNKMLSKSVKLNNRNYLIKVWKASMENDEVLEVIITVFITILVLLLLILFFINIKISKTLWNPFFETVNTIKKFNVSNGTTLEFKKTSISEFQELNTSLKLMTEKMILDYNNQKKFSENASHEFQTPLAVIKSKIDLLLQSKNLTENEFNLLGSIDDSISKLSKINKSLLLLSKIENKQFENATKVFIKPILEKIISNYEAYIQEKEITIINSISSNYTLFINEELGYILLNNLIQNAIRHNVLQGKITITNESNSLIIANSGNEKELNANLIFERFEKKSNDSNSIGLGLSIVKEIAELNTISIIYNFENNQHFFKLIQNIELK